jgi:ribosome-associated protein
MTTSKTETAAKKDVQKLQRAIVDGLEDVKAQDIQVFNTEHLSPLFERVIVASGTSNRQTKALASSVRDAVREAGFPKPRTEGEDNGEWIIVDCGAAVAHIMQPTIRQYYHLEEIWGDTPIRLKLGAPKPVKAAKQPAEVEKAVTGKARKPGKPGTAATAARGAAAPRPAGSRAPARAPAAPAKASTAKPTAPRTAAKAPVKAPAKTVARAVAKAPVKAPVKVPVKAKIKTIVVPAVSKAAARSKPAPAPAKKVPVRRPPGRKA